LTENKHNEETGLSYINTYLLNAIFGKHSTFYQLPMYTGGSRVPDSPIAAATLPSLPLPFPFALPRFPLEIGPLKYS